MGDGGVAAEDEAGASERDQAVRVQHQRRTRVTRPLRRMPLQVPEATVRGAAAPVVADSDRDEVDPVSKVRRRMPLSNNSSSNQTSNRL
jgi:hypothetical protein